MAIITIVIAPKVRKLLLYNGGDLKHDVHIETSSAYDIDIINKLYERKKITKDRFIICNGYKTKTYTRSIAKAGEQRFYQCDTGAGQ